jgi:hypothetical protein
MPDTNLLRELPITRDVEATPPAPTDVEPRTERHDWLFVGYGGTPKKNGPELEVWVTDSPELPRAVSMFASREAERHLYPYIFVAPALGQAFEEQATHALVAAAKRKWPDAVWALRFDFAPADAAKAEADRLAAIHREYWRDHDNQDHPAVLAADDHHIAVTRAQIEAALGQVPALDAEVRQDVAEWLGEEGEEVGLNYQDRYSLRSGTLEAIVTAHVRARIHAQLYAAGRSVGGWRIVLIEPDRDKRQQDDLPHWRTPEGAWLRTETEYRALLERSVLPISADRLVDFISDHHDEHSEDCDGLPSKRKIAAFIKNEGIRDPRPGVAVAPTAAALLAAQGMTESASPVAVLPFLAWGGRVTLLAAREKDGKSTLVGGAVAALTRRATWLGEQCAAVAPVLWLHEEAPDDVIGRLQQFGADLSQVHLLALPHADAARALTANVKQLRPGLVVIDSLVRYAAGRVTDPTRATQWEPIMSELLGLAQKSGAAIVVLHHAGKKDGEYRDSTEIGAGVDMLIQMPIGLKGNRQRLEGKGRIVGVAPYRITVELVGTAHQLVAATSRARDASAPATPTPLSERDRAVLGALVGTMGYSEWCKASRLKSKKTFDGIVKRLRADEAVVKTKDGRYRRS